jgi:ankyrin repeat protein
VKSILLACPTCKKRISSSAHSCPHCGEPLTDDWETKGRTERKRQRIAIAILLVPVLLIVLFVGSAAVVGIYRAETIRALPTTSSLELAAPRDASAASLPAVNARSTLGKEALSPAPTDFARVPTIDFKEGYAPLHKAAEAGDVAAVALLIKQGADVKAKVRRGNVVATGSTALHLAKTTAIASLLLDRGADKEARNSSGSTPLISAAERLDVELCAYLLKRGVNPNARDDHGRAALSTIMLKNVALKNIDGAQQIAQLLLDYRADVNTRDADGDTALFVAALGGLTTQVEFLLSRGADPNIQGEQGQFPLRFAVDLGDAKMAQSLLAHGANRDAKDKYGITAMDGIAEASNVSREQRAILRKLLARP